MQSGRYSSPFVGKRPAAILLITIVVTMLLAVLVNFIGLSEGGRQVAYYIILVGGSLAYAFLVLKGRPRR